MLVLIIEDKNNNTWSELHLNDNKLSGFSITNGMLSKFKKEYLELLNTFILSENQEKCESIDNYKVIRDKNNGFYHFFRDNKEDLNKFFEYNGKMQHFI